MLTTIILPISRPDYLRRIFAQFEMMYCKREETNLLVYVDGDQRLYELARRLTVESKFNEKICIYRARGMPDISSTKRRRKRIATIHNELKGIVRKCDYIFLTEDDTLLPLRALERLSSMYLRYPHAGFISGVQLGRHGITAVGVWQVDNPYEVKEIKSCLPIYNPTETPTFDVQEIDAAGLYCCLTKYGHYISSNFEPYEDILGPDVTFGINLRKEGYKNYVYWGLNTSHLTKHGEIKVYNTEVQQVTFTRNGKHWEQEIV